MRYLLTRQDEEGQDQLWGRCAGVEGLFVDPLPLPREVLTLRGCVPQGVLLDAVGSPGAAQPLGDMCVEVSDGERPVQWWDFVDTVVIATLPSRSGPGLVDVTVGAGVRWQGSGWPEELPASPQFELFAGTTVASGAAGRCHGVDGLFTPRNGPPKIPLVLVGCEPAERLLAVLRRPHRWERDWAQLWALDRVGQVMARHDMCLSITGAHPSVLGGALTDITLTDGGDARPALAARPIWETWYQGAPTMPNQWASYNSQGRSEWLDLMRRGWRTKRPDRQGGVYHLDGRFATDEPGVHCAMGEALVGPGWYFGWGWEALKDCLHGGFGVAAPFTLVWHDADISRQALAEGILDPTGQLSYFEEIVQLLERFGVTVILR